MKKLIDIYYGMKDRVMFHRSWYIMKTESLMNKGFTEEEAFKIYKIQQLMKKQNLNKYFMLKGKK